VSDWWGFMWMILAEARGLLTPENRTAAWRKYDEKLMAETNVVGVIRGRGCPIIRAISRDQLRLSNANDDGGGVWNKITRRTPSGTYNQFAHGTQPTRTKPVRRSGNISTPNACTRRSDISKSIPNSKCAILTDNLCSRSKALWASTPPVLVVDCPSNRLDGCLTLQKGFNRAFRLSAFMSSASRQRPLRPSRSPDHADDGNSDRQDGPLNAARHPQYLCG
jgi:hypothetical protein